MGGFSYRVTSSERGVKPLTTLTTLLIGNHVQYSINYFIETVDNFML